MSILLSSYAASVGAYNTNTTHLLSPGTKVVIHLKPSQRGTFEPHGIDRWYVKPAMEHYSCYKVWIPETGGIPHSDTVEFFPQQIPFPNITTVHYL